MLRYFYGGKAVQPQAQLPRDGSKVSTSQRKQPGTSRRPVLCKPAAESSVEHTPQWAYPGEKGTSLQLNGKMSLFFFLFYLFLCINTL